MIVVLLLVTRCRSMDPVIEPALDDTAEIIGEDCTAEERTEVGDRAREAAGDEEEEEEELGTPEMRELACPKDEEEDN